MMYKEKEISKKQLPKFVKILDLDEGIRIENKSDMIFLNKLSKRYCINIYRNGKDIFIYKGSPQEVINFLRDKMDTRCKIFSY